MCLSQIIRADNPDDSMPAHREEHEINLLFRTHV
jgi:hypothetical protein